MAPKRIRASTTQLLCSGLGTLALLLPATVAQAWAWQLVPLVDAIVSYETNPDNSIEKSNEDDATIASTRLQLQLSGNTPDSSLRFTPSARLRQAYGNDDNNQLDGTDVQLPLVYSRQSQRSRTNVGAGISFLPSRDSEYQVVNPNEPSPPGGVGCSPNAAGICSIDETQTRWYVAPGYSYDLSQRMQLSVSGQYSNVSYDESRITRRFDYDYSSASVSLLRILDARNRINVSLGASRYDAELPSTDVENRSDTISTSAGWEYAFSPRTSLNLILGASFNDFRSSGSPTIDGLPCLDISTGEFVLCSSKGKDSSFVGELFLTRRESDQINLRFGASQQIQPSSDGAQVEVSTLTAFGERAFTPRFKMSAGVSYIQQDAVGAETLLVFRQRTDRDYLRTELTARWKISRNLSLRGQFNYYTDEYDARSGLGRATGESRNQIWELGLTWVGPTYR